MAARRSAEAQAQHRRRTKALTEAAEARAAAARALRAFRYRVSAKEAELLQVFRELAACDFLVPDHHFDAKLLAEKRATKVAQESYTIPLNVFWRPVELPEHFEPNLAAEQWQVTRGKTGRYNRETQAWEPSLRKENFGRFLAKPLRDELRATGQAKFQRLQEGTKESGLRPVPAQMPKTEALRFDKFRSQGAERQAEEIQTQTDIIRAKTTKKAYEPYMPFPKE